MLKFRIYYEDTDCGGIVYHANYFKFCERARSEIFFSQEKMPCIKDLAFVVKNIHATFHKSARLGDLIEVKTQIKELKKVVLTLIQEVYKGEEKLFEMEVRIGFIDTNLGKPVVISPEIMEILCKL